MCFGTCRKHALIFTLKTSDKAQPLNDLLSINRIPSSSAGQIKRMKGPHMGPGPQFVHDGAKSKAKLSLSSSPEQSLVYHLARETFFNFKFETLQTIRLFIYFFIFCSGVRDHSNNWRTEINVCFASDPGDRLLLYSWPPWSARP